LHAGMNIINYTLQILVVHSSVTHLTTKNAGKQEIAKLMHYVLLHPLVEKVRKLAAFETVARM